MAAAFEESTVANIHLTMSCGDYDRTRPLIDGSVQPEGIDLTVIPLPTPERMFRMLQYDEFDVCESSSAMFLAARARGRRWTAFPVFPHRRFRHSYVFIRGDAGIRSPSDLAGRRVGVAVYMNSAALWIRGNLQHDYRVPLESITWVTGADEEIEDWQPPAGIRIERCPPGERLQNLLLRGDIDAQIFPDVLESFRTGDSRVQRLFPNYKEVEQDYFRRTGIFPIMHVMVVRDEVLERDPWVATALTKAFQRAKEACYAWIRDQRKSSLAWYGALWEEERALLGPDPWPYTFAENRATLETLLEYAHEQGLIPERWAPETLFAPSTLRYDPTADKTMWADR
jgi:4,5-dihydroxyphthalate decarboxylase